MHQHSHDESGLGDRSLTFAVIINLLLTVVEIIGGIFEGNRNVEKPSKL